MHCELSQKGVLVKGGFRLLTKFGEKDAINLDKLSSNLLKILYTKNKIDY